MALEQPTFQRNTHRLLRDMHIPDWDPGFLADYDPERLAARCQEAGLNAVMLYAKSHVGLCAYPTGVGRMHGNLAGRDVMRELNDALRARGISTAAYQSITFDNWAVETHPDWAQIDLESGRPMHDLTRYGVCCPNNPDYRAYELAIMEEILSGYEFDGIWLDMIFFLAFCSCPACRSRLRAEEGIEMPTVVDWTDPAWAAFQEARRRWIGEWTTILIDRAHELRPEIVVTHNLANALSGWRCGQPLAAGRLDTYTSADLYGDRFEHLVVTKMAQHLSASQPGELMVSVGTDLIDHVALKTAGQLATEALAATAAGSAFIVIDGIDPAGTEQPGNFATIRAAFEAIKPYEPDMGGRPVEDVAVYFSDNSFMDFADNGIPAGPPTRLGGAPFPHVTAARGAAQALTEAHVAFGVVTEQDLDRLADYRVVILPDVSRMTGREVDAFRAYVTGGGRLYASGYTSLVGVDGVRHDDFMLADVFGAALAGEEHGRVAYLTPDDDEVRAAVAPQAVVSQPFNDRWGERYEPRPLCTAPRVTATTGRRLAHLTLPYGDPRWGSVNDRSWAAIHSAPPWTETEHAALTRNELGAGVAVYSTFVLERSPAAANRALFTSLVRGLLGDRPTLSATARRNVWLSAYDQQDRSRVLVALHHYGVEQPAPAEPATVTVRPPAGRTFRRAADGPGARVVEAELGDGTAVLRVELAAELGFVTVEYA
ncbi:alpha-L-fucosidase [Micromonospora sp. WMMD882]|uniref:alpha-amylase family protein n=1 Tax=Micromonospora sp. WMMD882 TaxID=3015151 RepID=UPI00248C80A4|nr:alpha-amylase family protein [Micromonospora sp. WMMD882]WBB80320.1 alpha-L-fucosidase [Micromonospora sp. WMMD882]